MADPPAHDGTIDADGWIQMALREYEQVASHCNSQTALANAAAATSSPASAPSAGGDQTDLNPASLATESRRRNLHGSLRGYRRSIEALRRTHALLKAKLPRSPDPIGGGGCGSDDDDGRLAGAGRGRRPPPPSAVEAFRRHVELSERVIRAVTMQSRNSGGPCGVLLENGLVRTSSSGENHEVNIVALASLRASVSRLKVNHGAVGRG